MSRNGFSKDLMDLAQEKLASGELDRRSFVQLCAALGAGLATGSGVLGSRSAEAAANEIVVSNYGGDAIKFMAEAWGEPFSKDPGGVPVKVEGGSPLPGKIKAMVQSGKVTWDACDSDGYTAEQLGKVGLLEEVDYSVVDKASLREGFAWKHGIANYTYSFVLAYDKTKFPDKPPTYADFFDTKKYPGKRAVWKYMMGGAEACLLGDGVPADKLYPLDMKRALAKAKSLGKDMLYWDSGAESQQMLRDGEVIMANIWHTRASVLEKTTNGRITWTWDQGLFGPGAFVVPKGNPAGKLVNKFLASVTNPERQLKLLSTLGNGPSNPKASAMAPPELQRVDPSNEANLKRQIIRNEPWYEQFGDDATDKWLEGIAG